MNWNAPFDRGDGRIKRGRGIGIGAIEAYPASQAFMAPPEYNIGACGGIVIWTKR